MYESTGSPEAGAFHASVTELPLTEDVRPPGAPGAVTPAPIAFACNRLAEKHAACWDDCKQAATVAPLTPAIDAPDTCAVLLVVPAGATPDSEDGAPGEGAPPSPHAAASRHVSAPARAVCVIRVSLIAVGSLFSSSRLDRPTG